MHSWIFQIFQTCQIYLASYLLLFELIFHLFLRNLNFFSSLAQQERVWCVAKNKEEKYCNKIIFRRNSSRVRWLWQNEKILRNKENLKKIFIFAPHHVLLKCAFSRLILSAIAKFFFFTSIAFMCHQQLLSLKIKFIYNQKSW